MSNTFTYWLGETGELHGYISLMANCAFSSCKYLHNSISEPEPPKPVEEPAQKPTGKYVPPSMRRGMDGGSAPSSLVGSVYGNARSRFKKTAPNLTSEDDFPTLGGGPGYPRDMDGYVDNC